MFADNHCAINRSIDVQRHGVNQFLASGNIDGRFKKLVGAFVKASFNHCVIGAADDVVGRMRMPRARSCVALVDRVDLATLLSLSSQPLPASRLLLPRSGLERSDFVLWPFCDLSARLVEVWIAGYNGLVLLTLSSSHFLGAASVR